MGEKEQWYSNKELFEMMNDFKGEVSGLRLEMKETKMLIRDYNGLRDTINRVENEVIDLKSNVNTTQKSKTEYVGYIIAVISIVFTLLNYLK
ncbi:MAG: hypothetical protein GX053_12610 [Tissierella sp.]|nr:hypothetical protein [Tissierella sp.]